MDDTIATARLAGFCGASTVPIEYTPAGFAPDSIPWVAFSAGLALFWVGVIFAVRDVPQRPVPDWND